MSAPTTPTGRGRVPNNDGGSWSLGKWFTAAIRTQFESTPPSGITGNVAAVTIGPQTRTPHIATIRRADEALSEGSSASLNGDGSASIRSEHGRRTPSLGTSPRSSNRRSPKAKAKKMGRSSKAPSANDASANSSPSASPSSVPGKGSREKAASKTKAAAKAKAGRGATSSSTKQAGNHPQASNHPKASNHPPPTPTSTRRSTRLQTEDSTLR